MRFFLFSIVGFPGSINYSVFNFVRLFRQPYFGLGANSALEDVAILSDCIDETGGDINSDSNIIGDAVREFSRRRAKDSETLVRISRDLDRPGFIGAIRA